MRVHTNSQPNKPQCLPVEAVILAAGKGTRMQSQCPKVLHPLAGKPLLLHVLKTTQALGVNKSVLVLGHQAEAVQAALSQADIDESALEWVLQTPQLGTGHAVQQALPRLHDTSITVVLSGDVPLIQPQALNALVDLCAGENVALLTAKLDQPTGYGRIVRNNRTGDSVHAIVEEKDASAAQRAIREIYSGMMAAPTYKLRDWLKRIDNHNAQHEYYLTDVVQLAVADGCNVKALCIDDTLQIAGINSFSQLAELERAWQLRQAHNLMATGVRLADPARFDLRGTLHCGQDVQIDINCIFEGDVVLGDGVRVGAHSVLRNTRVAAGTQIHPFCHIDSAAIGTDTTIGPFARLRPGTVLDQQVHIGNFVEVKNSHLHAQAKANHLAYLGDASVGERVNYGAGSITANYDGANKHRTTIAANAHIGSNCVLVAPVNIGENATVGAGTTITKPVPADRLAITRAPQKTIANWQRPQKKGA